jgi:hypothetical protein
MTADSYDPVGIYFGTRSGKLFASGHEGRTWQKILEGLPSVACIRSAVVEDTAIVPDPVLSKSSSVPTSPFGSSRGKSRATSKSSQNRR